MLYNINITPQLSKKNVCNILDFFGINKAFHQFHETLCFVSITQNAEIVIFLVLTREHKCECIRTIQCNVIVYHYSSFFYAIPIST